MVMVLRAAVRSALGAGASGVVLLSATPALAQEPQQPITFNGAFYYLRTTYTF